MSGRSDRADELLELVKDSAADIVFDHLNEYRGPVEVQELSADTDDGMIFGSYVLYANGYTVTVNAQAIFEGFQDCWSWSGESHYTKPVYFEELEDFTYEVEDVQKEKDEPKLDLDK